MYTSGIFTRPLLGLTREDKRGRLRLIPEQRNPRATVNVPISSDNFWRLWVFFPLVQIKRLAEFARYRRRLNWSRASRCFGRLVLRWRTRALFSPRLMQLLSRLWKKNLRREVWRPLSWPPSQREAKVVISMWGDQDGAWISEAKANSVSLVCSSRPLLLMLGAPGLKVHVGALLVWLAGCGSKFPA